MNVITHALLPALLAAPLLSRRRPREYYASVGAVALAGALPDLLHPHLSLAARYASWSHSVFAWAGVTLLLLLSALIFRQRVKPIVFLLAALAYALHLCADGLSGGVAWLYPFAPGIVGRRMIPFHFWLQSDGVLILAALIAFFRWPPAEPCPPLLLPREVTPTQAHSHRASLHLPDSAPRNQ